MSCKFFSRAIVLFLINHCTRIVFVYDPTNTPGTNIPTGKQKLIQEHIFYTPCSGIWQTVWLESAPAAHIDKLDLSAGADGTGNDTYVCASGSANR